VSSLQLGTQSRNFPQLGSWLFSQAAATGINYETDESIQHISSLRVCVLRSVLRALEKLLRKAIINLITSVLTEKRDSHWLDFREDSYVEF
jgi:hypothetical protein